MNTLHHEAADVFPDRYDDEAPFDDGPYFDPSDEDLAWLISQRPDCEAHPETLAELDRQIGDLRRQLILGAVAHYLASRRQGHDA